jgi:copper chaperone CopZ
VNLPVAGDAKASLRTVKLSILGEVTASCPALVEAAVRRLEGIGSFAADLSERTVTIEYDPAVVSIVEIQGAIKKGAGFDSRIVVD